MKLKNIYILVKDTDRAIKFYTEILSFKLYRRQDRYTILQLDDMWFGLLNEKFEKNSVYGNNCVPVFEVEDVRNEYERLKKLNVEFITDIMKFPGVELFQFFDSEGNVLEIYEEK